MPQRFKFTIEIEVDRDDFPGFGFTAQSWENEFKQRLGFRDGVKGVYDTRFEVRRVDLIGRDGALTMQVHSSKELDERLSQPTGGTLNEALSQHKSFNYSQMSPVQLAREYLWDLSETTLKDVLHTKDTTFLNEFWKAVNGR